MMTFQHPYEHSPSQSWRSFPDEYDRPPALPQVPLIPRQPAAFDDHYYSDSDYLYHSQHRQQHTSHSLYPAPPHFEPLHMASGVAHPQPQGWAPETFHAVPQGFSPYEGFPAGSSFPPPRLEPPSLQPRHPSAMAGPLDPGGGVFYRSPEHPRLRTAQACEKCRVRKAKCSGDHPSCKRCMARGLACEYAKEGRTRGPNKTKKQNNSDGPATIAGPSKDAAASRSASKPPTPSTPPMNVVNHLHKEVNKRMSLPTLPRPHRLSLSMGEHRAERPRPPDLRLESHSMLYRLEGDGSSRQVQDVSPRGIHDESRRRVQHDTPRRLHAHSLSAGAVSPGLTPRFPPPGSSGRNLDGLASHDVAPISRRSREGSYDGSSCSSEGIGMYASQDGSGTSS
ncbi:hypothetical protein BD626DRAFT_270450 [Schizophyllum amplum]|uniref:Zn(2)-C6 fungal-type domain-containing protein n=1 Tax=Schizophyllum amplum TaxID=97359 RepID=A0A550BTP8_9AGAR|nr:hypothetical protein BD626DRAFT_270450 [Auriculariopsis ampla]